MKGKLARLGVLAASLLSLLGVTMPPTQATQVGTVAFVGDMTLTGGGLGYPCTLADIPGNVPGCLLTAVGGVSVTTKPGKLVLPEVNITESNGNTRGFGFSSTACVGVKLSVSKPGKGTAVDGPLCGMRAGGVVTGYCGLSSGSGSGLTGMVKNASFTFKFSAAGGSLIVTGTYSGSGKAGDINGIIEAIPDLPPAPGCSTKQATHFTIVGLMTLLDFHPFA